MNKTEDILKAFREKFSELIVRKSGKEYYAMILPKDVHEHDEYGLPDIEQFIKEAFAKFGEELISEDEDDMGWTPDNQTMDYDDACDIETRNQLRTEQRKRLKEMIGEK